MDYFNNDTKYFDTSDTYEQDIIKQDDDHLRQLDAIKKEFEESLANYSKTKITHKVKKYTLKADY